MSAEPRREEQEGEPAGSATNTILPTSAPSKPEEFPPHAVIDLRGVLICGQPRSRSSEVLSALCLAPLMDQVQQAGVWDINCADPEGRFGDYRFLVVEFTDTAGICRYVQVWTEPHCDMTMEVGPGNREDTALQALADRIRPTLTGRGFEIGGNANNFRKFLVAATADNARSVASEMLAMLTDVLGYDGTVDLTYHLHQDTRLQASHVLDGVSQSQLCDWFRIWGFHPRRIEDKDDVLSVRDRELEFRALLRIVKKYPKGDFWEVHCYTSITLPNDAASELLAEFNSKPGLFKVFPDSGDGERTKDVGITTAINLAGGVTPAHIRLQIMEWLELVRSLRYYRARQPEPGTALERSHTLN